jgi:hypothetical protein
VSEELVINIEVDERWPRSRLFTVRNGPRLSRLDTARLFVAGSNTSTGSGWFSSPIDMLGTPSIRIHATLTASPGITQFMLGPRYVRVEIDGQTDWHNAENIILPAIAAAIGYSTVKVIREEKELNSSKNAA